VVDPTLSRGLLGNTVAALAIGMGAATPRLGGRRMTDGSGIEVYPSATVPVPVLQADSSLLRQLFLRAVSGGENTALVAFPAFARSMHDFASYQVEFARRNMAEEQLHGIGLAGPRKWVASITGSLKLLS
jgi:hypothetical protein